MTQLEAGDRADTFVPHAFEEHTVDLGEIRMNYATVGAPELPALLLVPGQTESWWGYEKVMPLLSERFRVFAVDLRGQGRSTWTPGRYSLDLFGNDLVRFLDDVVGSPAIVAGNSSGGLIATWLAAYAKPGQLRGAVAEDAPLFSAEIAPACGPGIRQGMGPVFAVWHKWLGNQWSIGDWQGGLRALPEEIPPVLLTGLAAMAGPRDEPRAPTRPFQNLREYDPEWADAFVTGRATQNCDHATMLAGVRVPLLFTHHFRKVDEATGHLLGAVTDVQVRRAQQLVEAAGQPFTYRSFPKMPHSMHSANPGLYAETITEWAAQLSAPSA